MYVKGSAITWALKCILTQAYYQTGTMEIRFVGRRGDNATLESGFEPRIPRKIRIAALRLGVRFRDSKRIHNDEGRELYLRLAGLPKAISEKIIELGIDPIWPAVLVQRRIWSESQLDFLIKNLSNVSILFSGELSTTNRLEYRTAIIPFRIALVSERVISIIERLSGAPGCKISSEWTDDGVLLLASNLQVDVVCIGCQSFRMTPGRNYRILVTTDTSTGYRFRESQLECLESIDFVCVTRDYRYPPLPSQLSGSPVLQIPDAVDDLDRDVALRLQQARTAIAEVGEQQQ
ncbi:MAG: hypothetical protein KDB03_05135 [Planctomycetales bacterium]|nr:hypothetical protein [Planctomycetales bacterium]